MVTDVSALVAMLTRGSRPSYTGLRVDEWRVNQVLGEEPGFHLAGPYHVGDQQVVGSVVAHLRGSGCRVVRVNQDRLVRLKQPGQHRGNLLGPVRRPRDRGDLRDVPRVAHRYAAECL